MHIYCLVMLSWNFNYYTKWRWNKNKEATWWWWCVFHIITYMQVFQHACWPRAHQLIPNSAESWNSIACMLLANSQMIFLLQFGINNQSQICTRLTACSIFLVSEKFPFAYLFQIALRIIWLLIQMAYLWNLKCFRSVLRFFIA